MSKEEMGREGKGETWGDGEREREREVMIVGGLVSRMGQEEGEEVCIPFHGYHLSQCCSHFPFDSTEKAIINSV